MSYLIAITLTAVWRRDWEWGHLTRGWIRKLLGDWAHIVVKDVSGLS